MEAVESIASLAASALLAAVSIAVWLIHRKNQNVRMHKIGDLTENQKDLLCPYHAGNAWREFVDPHGKRHYVRVNFSNAFAAATFQHEPSLAIAEYADDMRELVVYGLIEEVGGTRRILRPTVFGGIEYERQVEFVEEKV